MEYFEQMQAAFSKFCSDPDFGVRYEQSAPMHPFEVTQDIEDDDVEILGEGDAGDAFGVRACAPSPTLRPPHLYSVVPTVM
jgi:hypothetical protein